MDEWDEEERKDDEDEERKDDLTEEEERNEELKIFLTEYKPRDKEGVVESVAEIMTGRVQFAIMDQINHMIYAAGFGNPDEIKKIVLRDVRLYIDDYRPPESNSEEGDEDSLK